MTSTHPMAQAAPTAEILTLLEAYQFQAEQFCLASPLVSGEPVSAKTVWVGRLIEIDSLAADQLPALHGEAIANGWLDFQIGSRTAGLEYRLSFEGRRLLSNMSQTDDVEAEQEAAGEIDAHQDQWNDAA